jgi:hypothetical protein
MIPESAQAAAAGNPTRKRRRTGPGAASKFDERIEEFGLLVGAHETARRVEEIPLDRVIPDPGKGNIDADAIGRFAARVNDAGMRALVAARPAMPGWIGDIVLKATRDELSR